MGAVVKTCFKCNRTLPRSEFYRHAMMADGLLGKCKDCTKADVKSRYYEKHDQVIAYERRRRDDPNRRASQLRRSRERAARCPEDVRKRATASRIKHPEQVKARLKLRRAVLRGTIIKPSSCAGCGATGVPIHGHHHDYSKPLDVKWLCSACHGLEHRKDRVDP